MTDKDIYFGGMPTGPDVKKLMDHWPNPKIGDIFPYPEVEKIIEVDQKSSRFRTVTNVWRRELLKKGVVVECLINQAFYVHNNKEIIGRTTEDITSIQRKLRLRRIKISTIHPKDSLELSLKDHTAMLCYQLEKKAGETKTKISSPKVIPLPNPERDNDD